VEPKGAAKGNFFSVRMFAAFVLCSAGCCLAMLTVGASSVSMANDPVRDATLKPGSLGQWTIVSSPNASKAHDNKLNAVTCTASSSCWAVGYYDTNVFVPGPDIFIHQTLIELWNGGTWRIVKSPNTSSNDYNVLNGVACASADDCWAVGYRAPTNGALPQTLIEHWNGKRWTIVGSPNNNNNGALNGVTCLSALECWAVGEYYPPDNGNGSFAQTFITRWDGTSWNIVDSPSSNAIQTNVLYDVYCVAASDCHAVGFHDTAALYGSVYQSGPDNTLTEHWDGISWTIIPSPNATTQDNNDLTGVTCTSSTDCWGVGHYNPGNSVVVGNYAQRLIEHWDGTSWNLVTSPTDAQGAAFSDVACAFSADCWTVGETGNVQTLIERWDGSSWSDVTSPNVSGPYENRLHGVTCVSGSNCWAVGEFTTADVNHVSRTLIERYTR